MSPPSLRHTLARTFFTWIAIFQLVVFCLSAWWVGWPLLRAASNDFAALIALSAQTWVELPPERRGALEQALMAEHGLQRITPPLPQADQASRLPFILLLQDRLGDLSGQAAQVAWNTALQRYVATVRLNETTLQFAFSRDRIGTNPLLAVLAIVLASLMLTLLVSHLISRRLARPLTRLERAAQAVGRGEAPALPLNNGVRELDGLTREFNDMARQVQAQGRTRATLLAGISHDLRSPITRLRMALELARNRPDPGLFDNMERYLEQMDTMIGDFIDYGRGISQRPAQALDLNLLLRRIADEHRAQYTPCGETIVSVEPSALGRVLSNLLENAHRHAPGSPPQIVLARDHAEVHVEVLDRGPGIPAAHLDKIFDPFHRVDAARQAPGSGLGLAIVREICRVHAWNIHIANRPDGGVQARLTLPAGVHDTETLPSPDLANDRPDRIRAGSAPNNDPAGEGYLE